MKKNLLTICIVLLGVNTMAQLQPTITGDNILCPEGKGVVSTQEFESYQWFRRYFGSTETLPVEGATQQHLEMDYYYFAASYLSVEVTLEGESATSPEFFVDGYAFLPAVVMSEGQYYVNENDEFVICSGDTLFFTLMLPYTVNITWYRNGVAIEGETGTTLAVTAPGAYYVEGAPEICPGFIQGPGLELVVVFCSGLSAPGLDAPRFTLGPVPAEDVLHLSVPDLAESHYRVFNMLGERVMQGQVSSGSAIIDVSSLLPGVYLLQIVDNVQMSRKFIKR